MNSTQGAGDVHGQRKIIQAIRDRLVNEPEKSGKPLRGRLKGYWKLRVGEFRVIYEIQKSRIIVYVIKAGLSFPEPLSVSLIRIQLRKDGRVDIALAVH